MPEFVGLFRRGFDIPRCSPCHQPRPEHANQTASLLFGGVTFAALWLHVLAPPEFEPVALKVVVPPVGLLPENSAPRKMAKLVQLEPPVKAAVKVAADVLGTMAPKSAPQLFDPVVAGGTSWLIVQPGEVNVMPVIVPEVGWHCTNIVSASPIATGVHEAVQVADDPVSVTAVLQPDELR